MRSSLNLPRLSQALRSPAEKHSERKAKTSKMVDLSLPLAEEDGERGNAFEIKVVQSPAVLHVKGLN